MTNADGAVVPISSAEFRLLMAFLEHPRQVLDRDRLLDMVQGREAHLFDRAIDNQISRLRRKIEARQPQSGADPDRLGRGLHARRRGPPGRCARHGMIRRALGWLRPRSLQGQLLLAVGVALLLAQAIGAVLLYQARDARREAAVLHTAAFRLFAAHVPEQPRRIARARRGERGPDIELLRQSRGFLNETTQQSRCAMAKRGCPNTSRICASC